MTSKGYSVNIPLNVVRSMPSWGVSMTEKCLMMLDEGAKYRCGMDIFPFNRDSNSQ
jgi:hypothetical protein